MRYVIRPVFTSGEADLIIGLLEKKARESNAVESEQYRDVIAKIQTTEGYLAYAGVLEPATPKEDFEQYVKNYNPNEYDVNKIFRDWVFERMRIQQ